MPIPRRLIFALAALLLPGLTACTEFPELDDRTSAAARNAPYPDLVPIAPLRADLPGARITPDTSQSLEARVAGLRARAARLRGRVIDSPSRARLSQRVVQGEGS